ncbi:unnamed protein product [Blepharisma stoltei]|uniref:Kelch repeat-containing protein n=1 Tax=Blepharisma stoltei TaxID=1481888 RepID=A0AAU9KCS0_9CILI|nr:unnamed protein product [Blepharisma stoltei]
MWDRGLEDKDKSNENANQQKGASKLKIPDKTFNNPLISKDLFFSESRREQEESNGFVIKPIPVEMSMSMSISMSMSMSMSIDNIEPEPIPQVKISNSKEITSQNNSIFFKEDIGKSSQGIRMPIVIPNASIQDPVDNIRSNYIQNADYSLEDLSSSNIYSMQKEHILLNTKQTIESLLNSSITQIKALSDLQDELMGIYRDTPNSDHELISKLNKFKNGLRELCNKKFKKNHKENRHLQKILKEQNIPASRPKKRKGPAIEESKIDLEPAPYRDLALKLNKNSVSIYDPLINKKINKFKWEKEVAGSAVLFTDHNSILHIGGNENKHEEIDIATGEKKYLPSLPEQVQFHCMAYINGYAAVIGGFTMESSSNKVYILKDDQWEEFDPLVAKRHAASSINVNKMVFVFGGISTQKGVVKSIDMWSSRWKLLNILQPIFKLNVGLCLYGGEIIIFGGKSGWNDIGTRDVWKFDYKTNKVSKLEPLYFDFFAKSGNECVLSGNIVYLLKKNEFNEYSLLENS